MFLSHGLCLETRLGGLIHTSLQQGGHDLYYDWKPFQRFLLKAVKTAGEIPRTCATSLKRGVNEMMSVFTANTSALFYEVQIRGDNL